MRGDKEYFKPKNCDECPYCIITDNDWLLCTRTGELLDYYLDYQGKLSPNCPFRVKRER